MRLILIVAHDENLVIGSNGKLPWHLPEDLKHFKKVTMGYPILMGRGVFEEIGMKPLPGRRNVVLSSREWDNIESYKSIKEALNALQKEDNVFLIGGGQIYEQLISECDYMYITEVEGSHTGDVYFPEYRNDIGIKWLEVSRESHDGFTFVEYRRIDQFV
jgi:dihydrofolate reductase